MTNPSCLNCGKVVTDPYCGGCGQAANTHRITFKNFFFHDVLHGTFHIEKGMLFTARQALVRPGKAALDYIAGKRKRYYNVFLLILVVAGLILFIRHFNDVLYYNQTGEVEEKKTYINEASKRLDEIFSQKSKIIIFLFVPFAALNGWILFRRNKLNLSEHSIIAGMTLLGMLLVSAFGNLFFYIDLLIPFNKIFASIISYLVTIIIILQIGYGYYNAFGSSYSKWGIAYRLALVYGLLALEIVILFYIVFGYITNWKYGTVRVSPMG